MNKLEKKKLQRTARASSSVNRKFAKFRNSKPGLFSIFKYSCRGGRTKKFSMKLKKHRVPENNNLSMEEVYDLIIRVFSESTMEEIYSPEAIISLAMVLEEWTPNDFRQFAVHTQINCEVLLVRIMNYFLYIMIALSAEKMRLPKYKELLELVLEFGGDILFLDNDGDTMACKALRICDIRVIRTTLRYLNDIDINAELNTAQQRAIHVILAHHHESFLHLVLEYNPDFNVVDINGVLPIHQAILMRDPHKLKVLLDAGADPNHQCQLGYTALHLALARKNESETCRLLFDTADLSLKNCYGDTPLHILVKCHRADIIEFVEILLKKGADPRARSSIGFTPLHYLTKFRGFHQENICRKLVEILLDHGADLNATDDFGATALHTNCISDKWPQKSREFLTFLLEKGANPNLAAAGGKTIVDCYSTDFRCLDQTKHLIRYLAVQYKLDKFKFGPDLLVSISSNGFSHYLHCCVTELSIYNVNKFRSTRMFRLTELIHEKSEDKLTMFARNPMLAMMMASFDSDKLPVYGHTLVEQYRKGLIRLKAEEAVIQFLFETIEGRMNTLILEKIVRNIPTDELLLTANQLISFSSWKLSQFKIN